MIQEKQKNLNLVKRVGKIKKYTVKLHSGDTLRVPFMRRRSIEKVVIYLLGHQFELRGHKMYNIVCVRRGFSSQYTYLFDRSEERVDTFREL